MITASLLDETYNLVNSDRCDIYSFFLVLRASKDFVDPSVTKIVNVEFK